MAVANYHDTYGHYPPPYLPDANGRPMHSWRVLILPFIEGDDLYKQYNFAEPWDGPNNRKLAARMPKMYAFSGTYKPGLTTTNYLAVVGPSTVWPGSSLVNAEDVRDGLGTTILIVENEGGGVHWMEPRDLPFETMSLDLSSPHGISSRYKDPAVVTLDGQVRRLRPNLAPELLRGLLTIAGGELIRDSHDGWEWIADGREREVPGR